MQPGFSGGAADNRRRDACLVVIGCRWLLLPVPKVASTLLKRLAVIADGRDPATLAVCGETRPALAIHRADLHALPSLSKLSHAEADALLADPHALRLAVTRHPVLQLAPVQAQGWGHPITSGSRTIHYYLSGEGMEPEGNDDHYSETLHRLPRTGLNYETPAALHDGQELFERFDLPRDRPILTSLQSTFKYLPRLDYGDFMGLFAIAHHTIDTIDWNGGNSSMQSFSLNCPVVTLPTAFMRGRHTVAMLEVLEIPELIAHDRDDYLAISCRLLEDQPFYNDVKERIRDRKQRLFHDKGVAEAFQIAVETLCRQRPLVGQQPSEILPLPAPPWPAEVAAA
jgi:hypothetical protein